MEHPLYFTKNKTELGLTLATKNIILERKKADEMDIYKLCEKKDK